MRIILESNAVITLKAGTRLSRAKFGQRTVAPCVMAEPVLCCVDDRGAWHVLQVQDIKLIEETPAAWPQDGAWHVRNTS